MRTPGGQDVAYGDRPFQGSFMGMRPGHRARQGPPQGLMLCSDCLEFSIIHEQEAIFLFSHWVLQVT